MNDLFINGSRVVPQLTSSHQCLSDLIKYVRIHFSAGSRLITSLKINGTELQDQDPSSYDTLPLNEIQKVEVQLAFPQEIAEDTLQALKDLVGRMPELCQQILRAKPQQMDYPALLKRLIDQIEILANTVNTVKEILRLSPQAEITELEQELVGTLRDLLVAHESHDEAKRQYLLGSALPLHFNRWKDQGIPQLIRSKDC